MINIGRIEKRLPVLGNKREKNEYLFCFMVLFLYIYSLSAHPLYQKFGIDSLKTKDGKIERIDSVSIKPFRVYHFSYSESNDDDKWPYGAGLLVTRKKNGKEQSEWFFWRHGEFPPHTIKWIDFNGDEKLDLWMLAGFEDEFESSLYLNRLDEHSDFRIIYNSKVSYAALIDIDNDNLPEILDAGESPPTEAAETWIENEKEINSEIEKEYDKIVGQFDKYNFDYNMPNTYKRLNLAPLSEFRIFKIKDKKGYEITKEHSRHVCWRSSLLKRVVAGHEMTKEQINETIKYLDGLAKCDTRK